jgi:hypothetical protein
MWLATLLLTQEFHLLYICIFLKRTFTKCVTNKFVNKLDVV